MCVALVVLLTKARGVQKQWHMSAWYWTDRRERFMPDHTKLRENPNSLFLIFLPSPPVVTADGCRSLSQVKAEVFFPLSLNACSDGAVWLLGFLSIIVGSLLYLIWHYIKKIELNWINFLGLSGDVPCHDSDVRPLSGCWVIDPEFWVHLVFMTLFCCILEMFKCL